MIQECIKDMQLPSTKLSLLKIVQHWGIFAENCSALGLQCGIGFCKCGNVFQVIQQFRPISDAVCKKVDGAVMPCCVWHETSVCTYVLQDCVYILHWNPK
jgi:hypothetical protein